MMLKSLLFLRHNASFSSLKSNNASSSSSKRSSPTKFASAMNALKRVKNDLEVSTGSREDNHNKTLLLKVVGKKSRSSAAGSRFSRPYSSSSLKKSRPKVFPALPPAFEERLANWKEDIEAAKKQEESERKNSSDWLNANLVLKRVLCKPLGDEIALSANMMNPGQIIELFSVCKPRQPILLKLKSGEAKSDFFGFILSTDFKSKEILIYQGPKRQQEHSISSCRDIQPGDVFDIRIKQMSQLQKLLDFLDEQKTWPKLRGYPVFQMAYRAQPINIVQDRSCKLSKDLNPSQIRAVEAALSSRRKIVAIHGPPGTGKTRVIAETIMKLIQKEKNVLVCAPTHKASDNVLVACIRRGMREEHYLRIGGDTTDEGMQHLNSLIEQNIYYEKIENYYAQIKGIQRSMDTKDLKCDLIIEQLGKLYYLIDRNLYEVKQEVFSKPKIVFCTTRNSLVCELMRGGVFTPDLVIMDEAAQIMESWAWMIAMLAPKLVLLGDPFQLGPQMPTWKAIAPGPGYSSSSATATLLEHLHREFAVADGGENLVNFMLDVQYRSNELIQKWSNQQFYGEKLKSDPHVSRIVLADLKEKKKRPVVDPPNFYSAGKENNKFPEPDKFSRPTTPFIDYPLILVDTDLVGDGERLKYECLSGAHQGHLTKQEFREQRMDTSYYNTGEAILVSEYLKALLSIQLLEPFEIGCITPYSAQSQEIQRLTGPELSRKLIISSVDAFQGQEREAIVMSFVRNNAHKRIGFLAELRRMNVAITRARRQFVLVASSSSISSDRALLSLLELIRKEGLVVKPSDLFDNKISANFSSMQDAYSNQTDR